MIHLQFFVATPQEVSESVNQVKTKELRGNYYETKSDLHFLLSLSPFSKCLNGVRVVPFCLTY
jgi:hypothetical protein